MNSFDSYSCNLNLIKEYFTKVQRHKNTKNLRALYSIAKELAPAFYKNGKIDSSYANVISYICEAEKMFNNTYLIDTSFSLDSNKLISFKKCKCDKDILTYIVNSARISLIEEYYPNLSYDELYSVANWNFDVSNRCLEISTFIDQLCKRLKIHCEMLEIVPGYYNKEKLYNGTGYHFANLIELDDKWYLVDITYSQFFNNSRTNIGRIGLMNYLTTSAGYFMTLDEERKKLAVNLLKNGYIPLNGKNFKMYMDGFTISFRNGLFYRCYGDKSYTTDYSVNDYINFLSGYDNQVKHEGREVLGLQKKPI